MQYDFGSCQLNRLGFIAFGSSSYHLRGSRRMSPQVSSKACLTLIWLRPGVVLFLEVVKTTYAFFSCITRFSRRNLS